VHWTEQRRYAQADPLYKRAQAQGRYAEAGLLYKCSLATETTLGSDHAYVGNTLSNFVL
jgi:hypothetical protein